MARMNNTPWLTPRNLFSISGVLTLLACSAGGTAGGEETMADADDAGFDMGEETAGGGSSTTLPNGNTGGLPSSGGADTETGGSAAGGTPSSTGGQAGATCTPGGAGFQQETGYAIDQSTCVFYQVFDAIPERLSHAAAGTECESLSLAGFNDWRLPTLVELQAIVMTGTQPSVDASIFPNTDTSLYWTSMTTSSKVTALDFFNDGMQNDNIGADGAQGYRCVRSGN